MEISNLSSLRSLSILSLRSPRPSPSISSLASRRSRRADHARRSTRRSSLALSPRRASSRLSSVESSSAPPPLPASSLAHFLAVQYLSDDPAQTLLELTRHAPGAQPLLVETLTQRQNEPPAPDPADCIYLTKQIAFSSLFIVRWITSNGKEIRRGIKDYRFRRRFQKENCCLVVMRGVL